VRTSSKFKRAALLEKEHKKFQLKRQVRFAELKSLSSSINRLFDCHGVNAFMGLSNDPKTK